VLKFAGPAAAAAAAVQVKMRELGVLGNANYKLVCMLDHKAMLTVQTEKYGVFDCKPLQFIWAKVRDLDCGVWGSLRGGVSACFCLESMRANCTKLGSH
jgi:hypothetical protein